MKKLFGGGFRGRSMVISSAVACAVGFSAASAQADTLSASLLAPGYTAESIELGVPFGGAVAQHPTKANIVYVSAGNYGEHTILEVNTDTGTTQTVSPQVGNIGGIAVLNNGDLAITENMVQDTILRARDLDADGLFLSPGEISTLIAPPGAPGTFTGEQAMVVPAGNAAGLPAGTLLVQTADGGSSSSLLAIGNPESATPGYLPPDAGWFTGFTYNGGMGFSPDGHVVMGTSDFPVGRVLALVNANNNDRIEPEEAREIIGSDVLEDSISDLAVSGDGLLVTTENSGLVRWFDLPADLATGTVQTSGVLALTNGVYLSAARLREPSKSFRSGAAWSASTSLLLGGFVSYPAATNLLVIKPIPAPASACGWMWLE